MSEFTKDLEDYFCKFTFGQFVTLILLELVTLFFVFYLGARYGPDLIGSRREVAKKSLGLPADRPKTIDEIVGTPQVDYTFPEVLTDPTPSTPRGTKKEKEVIRIKPSGVTVEEFERQKFQKEKQTILIPVEKEEVAPMAAPSPPGKYAIQVGSYPTAEEANRMIDRWKKKGYDSFLSVGEIPNRGTWYRVRLGSFPSREEATRYLEQFKGKEKTSALVVQSQS